jgi:hypothetical protein
VPFGPFVYIWENRKLHGMTSDLNRTQVSWDFLKIIYIHSFISELNGHVQQGDSWARGARNRFAGQANTP